jgi:hypothetical protein
MIDKKEQSTKHLNVTPLEAPKLTAANYVDVLKRMTKDLSKYGIDYRFGNVDDGVQLLLDGIIINDDGEVVKVTND